MTRMAMAFESNSAFLAEVCHFADALIERALCLRQLAPMPDDEQSLASRRRQARQQHVIALDESLEIAWQHLQARMEASLAQDRFIPWVHLARLFRLTPVEQQLMWIALLPDLDTGYGTMLADVADGDLVPPTHVPLSAAVNVMLVDTHDLQAALLADNSLRRWRMIELAPGGDTLQLAGGFRIDPVLAAYICGKAAPQLIWDDVLAELPATTPFAEISIDIPARVRLERFIAHSGTGNGEESSFLLQLQGPDERFMQCLAVAVFARLNMRCVPLNLARMYAEARGADRAVMRYRIQLLCRNALLCNRVLLLSGWQHAGPDDEYRAWAESLLDTLLQSQRYVIAINGRERALSEQAHRYAPHRVLPVVVHVALPDAAMRQHLWKMGAQRRAWSLSESELDQLTHGYRFTHTQIEAVWKECDSRCLFGEQPGDAAMLLAVCREASTSESFTVAEEVKSTYRLDDIVLPNATRGWLVEVLHYAQHRHHVIEQWGFERSHGNSRNLCVLFHGPSGTGKTMAASVIANELNLGLYRIDLANVLSKYIGETEKHLAQLFDQAEAMNIVLYFDEAESLFGKRTETKDSHDRYANLQTGYLLQRIETYPGIVVLSTNLLGNMDKAFMRRFKFVIEYPFPNAAQRQQLWRKAFPAETPISEDVDFALLADRAYLSGGNISTIALRAAVYASADGDALGMRHLLRAIEREYDKLGKVFLIDDFRWRDDE